MAKPKIKNKPRKKYDPRPCLFCTKKFTPTREWQKYCPGGKCKDGHRKRKFDPAPYEEIIFKFQNILDFLSMTILKVAKEMTEAIVKIGNIKETK